MTGDHVMLLDFDRDVVGLASQPFWLRWHDGVRERRHAPDFFARLADGTGVVVDVRADDRIEPADVEAFEATGPTAAAEHIAVIGIPENRFRKIKKDHENRSVHPPGLERPAIGAWMKERGWGT